jgi:hypothetical protein
VRFKYGPVPEDPDFKPEEGGWRRLREPSILVGLVLSFPIGVLAVVGLLYGWSAVLTLAGVSLDAQNAVFQQVGPLVLPAVLVSVPVHELIHAVFHPQQGRSSATVVGARPTKGVFYAQYFHELSWARHLVILAGPFVVLSLVPLLVGAALHWAPPFIIALSTINGLGSCMDLFYIFVFGLQVPVSATSRNKGWRTWWRESG